MYGFTCTHLSGTGVSDYGDLLILPYSSPTKEGDHIKFFKEDEHAQAGYYACILDDGTRIEATAGDRAGILRIRFGEAAATWDNDRFEFSRPSTEKDRSKPLGIGEWQGSRRFLKVGPVSSIFTLD